jgi:error-prone DNA polymerase
LRTEVAKQIEAAQPFASVDDLRRRTSLNHSEVTTLAEIGALNIFGMRRREALWQIERAWRPAGPLYEEQLTDSPPQAFSPSRLLASSPPLTASERMADQYSPSLLLSFSPTHSDNEGMRPLEKPSPLRDMTIDERMNADYRGTGVTLGPHPMTLRRAELRARQVYSAAEVRDVPNGKRVRVAGSVIARQRPSTARGVLFISLEDETGIANVIVPVKILERYRMACVSESFIEVVGIMQSAYGVFNVRAERVEPLRTGSPIESGLMLSHDFH